MLRNSERATKHKIAINRLYRKRSPRLKCKRISPNAAIRYETQPNIPYCTTRCEKS